MGQQNDINGIVSEEIEIIIHEKTKIWKISKIMIKKIHEMSKNLDEKLFKKYSNLVIYQKKKVL